MLMSKEKEHKELVPELRFPEFRDEGKWDKINLSELLDFKNGINASKEQYGKGIKFINVLDIIQNSFITYDKIIGSVEISENEISKNEVSYGDILFQRSSETREDAGQANVYLDKEKKAVFGGFVIRGKKKRDYNPVFMNYLLKTEYARKEITSKSAGSTRFNIGQDSLKEVLVILPKLAEQQKIASTLTSLDQLIAAENEKLEALKAHKKGLLQQLFPAKGKKVPDLRFGEFSGEWEEKELIEVTDKNVKWSFIGGPFGSNLKSSDYVNDENGIRIIQLQNIGDGEFKDNYKIFTSIDKADELISNNIYPGEIIMSKMGDPVGRACLIPDLHERYVMSSDGIRVVVDEKKYDKYFIYTVINSKEFRSKVENSSTGSTRKRIGLSVLKKLTFSVPLEKTEQEKIARCLYSIDNLIDFQLEEIESLKEHKKGLIQQLFPNPNTNS